MYQRKGISIEEYLDMPAKVRDAYIASELCELKNPVTDTGKMLDIFKYLLKQRR